MRADLPWPPSTNHIYRAGGGGKRLLTDAARIYRWEVLQRLMQQNVPRERVKYRLAVMLEIFPPTAHKLDIDNRIKSVLDALQHCGVYANDEQVDALFVMRRPMKPAGGVTVYIREAESEEP